MGKRTLHPAQQAMKEQQKNSVKRAKKRQQDAKNQFLRNQDAEEMIEELVKLDDMENNPQWQKATTKTEHGFMNPAEYQEKFSEHAIELKRGRIHARLNEMIKMYENIKQTEMVEKIKSMRQAYFQSNKRKTSFGKAIKNAATVDLEDIIMPSDMPEESKTEKMQREIREARKSTNRVALEASTRQRNRERGVPPPPSLALPRAFKRFKHGKAPPPPPPKSNSISKPAQLTNFQKAAPSNDMLYENPLQTTEGSFKPSSTKRAQLNKPKIQISGASTVTNPGPKPNIKNINSREMKLFVPRGLAKDSGKDSIMLKRNQRMPPPPPKKGEDEFKKFQREVGSL